MDTNQQVQEAPSETIARLSALLAQANIASAITAKGKELKDAQTVVKARKGEFIALLPVATAEQVEACVRNARDVECPLDVATMAAGRNMSFRLTEEQSDQVAAAKAEHAKTVNDDAVKLEASGNVAKATLTSYKLRVRADGKTTLAIAGVL